MVFAVIGLSSFALVDPSSIAGVVGCAVIAGGIPAKMMLNFKNGSKRFKEDGNEGGGGSGKSDEDKLLDKIKSKIDEAIAPYKEKLAKAEKDSTEALQLKTRIEGIEALKTNLKGVAEFKTLLDEVVEMNLKVKGLEEKLAAGGPNAKTLRNKVNKFIEDNAAKIVELKRSGSGVLELEFKAVDVMVTTSASNPDGIPELVGVQMAPPTNVNLRDAIVDQLVTIFATSLAAFPYTESLPKDGNFGFVLEKGSKPQIDFKIETRYAEPKKVAAHMELSEESVKDIPGLQSIANDYLRRKHALKRQNGILFGDGIGANPKGATKYARIFTAGAMKNKVTKPNMMDVINAAVTDIFTTHNFTDEMPYMANIAMMNPMDFFTEIVAAKDENGLPLYPMASLFNRVVMGGVLVIPFEDIPAGKIFVADLSKYNVTNYVPYMVRIGWINDNFIKNIFCIVGESRFHAFVKKLDEQAFIYDDIDTIKGLLDGSISS